MICNFIEGIKREEQKKVIAYDEGFGLGLSAFETILVKNAPVFLKEHINRLNSALKVLGIEKEITEELFIDNTENVVDKVVKIGVSNENIVFTSREIPYTEENYKNGLAIRISNKVKRNKNSHATFLKSNNYIDNIIERNDAKTWGYDEVIFENHEGEICEGSVSNIFIINGDKISTPHKSSGLLSGIIREYLLGKEKIKVNDKEFSIQEEVITRESLMDADGIFLTNSIMGIIKVNSINGIEVEQSLIVDELRSQYLNDIEENQKVHSKSFEEDVQSEKAMSLEGNECHEKREEELIEEIDKIEEQEVKGHIIDIDRASKIISYPKYKEHLKKIEKHEKKRKWCKHNIEHFIDTSRIMYIMSLERGLGFDKELIYACGLLHDIGRWEQYERNIPHNKSGAELCVEILEDCGFNAEEIEKIQSAIYHHRVEHEDKNSLEYIMYKADKASRACYSCKVSSECNWDKKEKNLPNQGATILNI